MACSDTYSRCAVDACAQGSYSAHCHLVMLDVTGCSETNDPLLRNKSSFVLDIRRQQGFSAVASADRGRVPSWTGRWPVGRDRAAAGQSRHSSRQQDSWSQGVPSGSFSSGVLLIRFRCSFQTCAPHGLSGLRFLELLQYHHDSTTL